MARPSAICDHPRNDPGTALRGGTVLAGGEVGSGLDWSINGDQAAVKCHVWKDASQAAEVGTGSVVREASSCRLGIKVGKVDGSRLSSTSISKQTDKFQQSSSTTNIKQYPIPNQTNHFTPCFPSPPPSSSLALPSSPALPPLPPGAPARCWRPVILG